MGLRSNEGGDFNILQTQQLERSVNQLERENQLQRDVDRLERWLQRLKRDCCGELNPGNDESSDDSLLCPLQF